jgi:DNA-binding NtrC family response regulator
MSDPEIKIEDMPEAVQSGWNGQQNAALSASTPRNVVEWPKGALPYSLRSMRAQAEIYAITRALEEAGWNRKRAAQLLRISYRGLLYKISSHKITRQTSKPETLSAEGTISFATNQIK